MIAWILSISSFLILVALILKKMRVIKNDLVFQKDLEEEQKFQEEDIELKEVLPPENEVVGSARQNFLKGDAHFGRGEFDDAIIFFMAAISADETHLDSHHKLGLLHMKRSDFGQAELAFSKLINLKKDPIYYSNLGAALYRQGRLIEAAEAYENAIALDDKRAERLQSLAQVYHELGDSGKALKYFELASHRKPKNNELKMILADYYEQLGRLDEVIELMQKILELDPYNKEIKTRLKLVQRKAGK
ncbi:MAG: tetratricopeptide repeat protein [Patescibacteria group bacterium]